MRSGKDIDFPVYLYRAGFLYDYYDYRNDYADWKGIAIVVEEDPSVKYQGITNDGPSMLSNRVVCEI